MNRTMLNIILTLVLFAVVGSVVVAAIVEKWGSQ